MTDLFKHLVQQQATLRTQIDELMKTMMAECSITKERGTLEQIRNTEERRPFSSFDRMPPDISGLLRAWLT